MSSSSPKNRTGILVILDGFGINPQSQANAIALAKTPTLDYLLKTYPHTELDASESHVGLPSGFMGNSEVGHLNIGAGRVVYQDFSLISRAIETGEFDSNPAITELMGKLKPKRRTPVLHLIGLLSDGGVHSHLSHLFALIDLAKRKGVGAVTVHAITDGRDTSPTSGVDFVKKTVHYCRDAGLGSIGTVMGRFYAMDRDSRWDRTQAAFQAMVHPTTEPRFQDPVRHIEELYDTSVTDEFLPPAVAQGYSGIQDGDGVIFYNFRADRARQLTRAFTDPEFSHFPRPNLPTLAGFVTMTPYDEKLHVSVAFEKPKVLQTLGEVVSRLGWKQLRVAETEKYAHVTYFFNGGEEKAFEGEKRVLIPSPREVKTYDLKPEMSARQVTESLLNEVSEKGYEFVVVNFANCDMVGHTGNLNAAIQAVETVDGCLGRIIDWVESKKGFAIVTADHGNCEQMVDSAGRPLTSHTLLPVPFILVDAERKGTSLVKDGRLCDIAPTMLAVWGVKPPKEMTGHSLLAR